MKKPITERVTEQMWELCCVHKVDREVLRSLLGPPHFLETDSLRTHGGDEDWWGFELDGGHMVALAFRVPYGDAVLLATTKDATVPLSVFAAVVHSGELEHYETAVPA